MNAKSPLSVVIICRNAAKTIHQCVNAATSISQDIIVVDSGSDDGSTALASAAGARVINHDWQGYGANKNYGASLALHDWIVSIDADEVLDETLIKYLQELQPQRGTVYQLNSIVYLAGQWVRHSGWHPIWKHRVYHRADLRWNDAKVHEDLTPLDRQQIQQLPGVLLHYSYTDKHDHQLKTDRYARLRAEQWLREGRSPSIAKRLLGPTFRWVRTYILKQGFRDGAVGLYIARSNAAMIRAQIRYYDQLRHQS